MKLTYLKILHYPLSNKKIKGIVHTFQNIIHLDFGGNMDCISKTLKLIAKSYSNLKYLNIFALPESFKSENDISLFVIGLVQNLKYQNPKNPKPDNIMLNSGQFFRISYHSEF